MDQSAVDEEIDKLYELPPGDFTAARNDLVKRLKKEGDKDAAASVGGLRRPNAAAWAVNQLVRRRRDELEKLVGLGAALRAAQAEAIAGADADELRTAARARREAVGAMAEMAAAALAEQGSAPDAHLGAITATLEAATLDADAGSLVLAGKLTTELHPPSGFGDGNGDLGALPDGPRPTATAKGKDGRAAGAATKETAAEKRRRSAAEKREAAEQAVAEARQHAEDTKEEAVTAAGRAEETRRQAEAARAEVESLERQLEEAEQRARAAAKEADAAKRAAIKSEAAATEAVKQLARAEDRLAELPEPEDQE